jgi:hypothetical protein
MAANVRSLLYMKALKPMKASNERLEEKVLWSNVAWQRVADLTGRPPDLNTTRHSQLRLTNSCPFVLAQRADTDVADSSHECHHRDRAYYEIHLLG